MSRYSIDLSDKEKKSVTSLYQDWEKLRDQLKLPNPNPNERTDEIARWRLVDLAENVDTVAPLRAIVRRNVFGPILALVQVLRWLKVCLGRQLIVNKHVMDMAFRITTLEERLKKLEERLK